VILFSSASFCKRAWGIVGSKSCLWSVLYSLLEKYLPPGLSLMGRVCISLDRSWLGIGKGSKLVRLFDFKFCIYSIESWASWDKVELSSSIDIWAFSWLIWRSVSSKLALDAYKMSSKHFDSSSNFYQSITCCSILTYACAEFTQCSKFWSPKTLGISMLCYDSYLIPV
jgi:hypothetical protein